MCPEVERSFDNMYSVKRGQPFAPLPAHSQTEVLLP